MSRTRIRTAALPAFSLAAAAALTCALSGCAQEPPSAEQTPEAPPAAEQAGPVATADIPEGSIAWADFSLNVLEQATANADATDNALISPLSIGSALGMTSQGAQGETLSQMEGVFGMSTKEMQQAASAFTQGDGAENAHMRSANSLWIRNDMPVKKEFAASCEKNFGASVMNEPFDETTAQKINAWVAAETDGMIKDIIDEASPQDALYLINAVAFDAAWMNPYQEGQIEQGTFTAGDGEAQSATMMTSSESLYFEGAGATGFLRPYEGGRYAFAALLPEQGTTPREMLAGMTGSDLVSLFANASFENVVATIPQFSGEEDYELRPALGALGMTDAFDAGKANLSGIADAELSIASVAHKTFISVTPQGTKAGAATSVEARVTSAGPADEPKIVRLDRPFAYAIIDVETNLPAFIGFVQSVE